MEFIEAMAIIQLRQIGITLLRLNLYDFIVWNLYILILFAMCPDATNEESEQIFLGLMM